MDFTPLLPVTIIGAGPSGLALAADLQLRGHAVLVYTHPTHRRQADRILQNSSIIHVTGLDSSFSSALSIPITLTTCITAAVTFSPLLILTVPSTGQETILHTLRETNLSLQNHTLLAIPGNLISLLPEVLSLDLGWIIETNLSPYSCRLDTSQVTPTLSILGKKSTLWCSGSLQLPHRLVLVVECLLPCKITWTASILETSLGNVNGVFHPLMMLMNTGWLESSSSGSGSARGNGKRKGKGKKKRRENFLLYAQGLSPSVARAMDSLDKVRINIAQTMGYDFATQSAVEISNACYAQRFGDAVSLARGSGPHRTLRAPDEGLAHRNVVEDVPDLLVCWMGLAEKLGVDATPIKAVVGLAEMATGKDFVREGRGLQRLGLEGMTRDELVERFGRQREEDMVMAASRL